MDVSKETAERAESVVSDVLISDSCVENIISLIDNYEITSIENKCDQSQSLPGSDPHQETSILDILISDSSVENIISCIDSYEKTSAENKLQSLPEADSHQEPLDNDQDMTQPPSEPDAQQETEPLHTDPNKAHSAANSLNLSEDETQPPSEPDTTQETEPPDMDQDKETVLPSSRCLENSLNLSQDAHQGTQPLDMAQDKEPVLPSSRCSENPLNLSQGENKTQPPSEPDATQETERLDMDQDKEPGLPFSRCSENFLNLSQGSQQSTLPPPASQQRSSGFPLSFRNSTFAKYDPAYGESIMKVPKRQQRSNTISEKSKMKQIKEIHKHLYQLLKNANVLAQSDRNLLANAKQMLFSIKTHHAVLCESLKSACMRKVPLHKCRESLKEKIRLLQNRQHKLLLLFQEHNVITKKIKMLDSDWRKRAEIAAKGQSLLTRLAPKNLPSFSKSKTFTKNLKPESESASTIYSFDCSQEKKRSVKKKKKERDCSVLHKSQQSMSESAMIFNNRMNQSRQKPMSESAMISGNKMNQSCQKPMSESVVISGNKMNLSQQPMSESTMISSNKMNQSRQQPMSESSMIFNNKMNQSHQQPMSESSMIFNNKMTQFTLQPMSELAMISDNKMNDSSQQSMSESSMISDNKMNLSSEQTVPESVKMNCSKTKFPHCSKQTSSYPINTADQTPKPDSKTPTCPSWLNKDTSDDASVSLLPNMSTNCTQFTATPIGTIADFTKNIIRSQQDFGNDQLVPKPAVTSADQQLQSPVVASLHFQNVPVSSFGDDISTSTNSQTVTANGARSFETRAKTKELQQSFDEDDCGISALTHLALIEDRELVPLDSILPSCQDTDIFANINFPKFLWEGFYKWP